MKKVPTDKIYEIEELDGFLLVENKMLLIVPLRLWLNIYIGRWKNNLAAVRLSLSIGFGEEHCLEKDKFEPYSKAADTCTNGTCSKDKDRGKTEHKHTYNTCTVAHVSKHFPYYTSLLVFSGASAYCGFCVCKPLPSLPFSYIVQQVR